MYWLQWERKYVDQLFISFILFCFPNSDLVEADIYYLASVLTWLSQQRIPILTPYKMHILQHQTPNNFMHQEKDMKKISIFRYLLLCDFRQTNNFLVFVEVYKNIFPRQNIWHTWTRGHEGWWMWASALAARAPLRNVGPRLIVMLENLRNIGRIYTIVRVINRARTNLREDFTITEKAPTMVSSWLKALTKQRS